MRRRGGLLSPAFADALTNLLIVFVALFILSFIQIHEASKKVIEQPDYRASIIIIAEWSDESNDDVDIYVQNPNEEIVFFTQRDIGWMNLDRDMRGKVLDKSDISRETVTIRKLIPGEYIVNLHMFGKRDPKPTSVKVRVLKTINGYAVISETITLLSVEREEQTIVRFTTDLNGNITDLNKRSKRFIR